MQLKLKELQKVAKETIKEEHSRSVLRDELFRVLGSPVMVSKNFEKVAEAANEQLDLLESTGRSINRGEFKISVLIEASKSTSKTARKIAARLLPERFSVKFLNDPSSEVRCAAAKRLPSSLLKESVRNHPLDDQLRTIYRAKKISEAGIPAPKPVDEPFDMYGEPLGDAVKQKQVQGKDMPDTWYKRLAAKLCSDYGTNLEGQWEEILATRIVASHYSTTGVKLDREKLLKSIYDCIKEREDAVLGEGSLKAISSRLLRESYLDEAAMPVIEDRADPVVDLLESNFSSVQYIDAAEKLFSVRKSSVPAGIKKHRLGEGHYGETLIPVNGKVPGGCIDSKVENALDRYVDSWNKRQTLAGEPYRLSWGPHPTSFDMIGFNLELK